MASDRQKLMQAARRLLDSRADAEDAVQDTYLRAFNTFSDWRTPEPAWMHTVLRNIAIDRLRRLRTESHHADEMLRVETPSHRPADADLECEAAVRHLLARLGVADAAALLLREVFELDYQEVAALLGKREPAIRQTLHRAKLRVRTKQAHFEVDEFYFELCCRAILAREPTLLLSMLKPGTAQATKCWAYPAPESGAGTVSRLVHVNGRYAIALVLDGVVLCIVPLSLEAMTPGETV